MNTVLIVDDDLRFQRILGIALQKYKKDFEVMLANNGEEAINVLEHHAIDLLVTDIQMPKVDGWELLAYLNKHQPETPFIIMTAYQSAEKNERYKAIGNRFLKKPFDINTLAQAILKALKPARPDGALRGISVANFLQMIELEQKTCLLEVTSPFGETGILYLENGELYDAAYRDLKGESAAFELIAMDDARISFEDFPEQAITRRITTNLMALIMESLRLKDEMNDY